MAQNRTELHKPAAIVRRPAAAATVHRSATAAASVSPAQALQRRLGNQGTQALISRSIAGPAPVSTTAPVSAQFARVSQPNDPAEIEARDTARKVINMSEPAKPQAAKADERVGQPLVQRDAISMPVAPISPAAGIAPSGGSPLPSGVRSFMEPRFGADFGNVRIHTGEAAAQQSAQLSAHAFTVGEHVFFGRDQFQPQSAGGRELIAHELTHTVQQGAVVQRSEDTTVSQRAPLMVQRFGIGDALDWIADKANYIPGFRLLTIVLGVNPINMSKVDRNAANLLRALLELVPVVGPLIVQALDSHGIFAKVGAWFEVKVKELGLVGSALKGALMKFLDSLSWTDIFHLGDVWDRAKAIFTEPIDRLINFGKSVASDIIGFVRQAILLPLAKLAEGTRGYDLLKAVLGEDPVTGQPVPRNAETLIGGFMKFIHQEEVWENIKKSNAIPRAWAWFQSALGSLMGFLKQIPTLFINALKALEIIDLILPWKAFGKIAGVFGGFAMEFVSWAGHAVWNLIEIIFDVVSPGALFYIKKTGPALKSILKNPLPFVRNLVRAAKLGFTNFADHFLTHLQAKLIDWLTGSLPGIYIPKAFSLMEIGKFVFSVLGLSWANIRVKLVKVMGETAVKAMETGFDIVVTLVRDGPAAAWDKIKEQLSNLKDMVIGGITDFVVDMVVKKAIPRLISMFIPGAGFITAILSIYDTIMVFVRKISKIIEVVKGFIDSIVDIAGGAIDAAAKGVETTLANLLSLAINFLAGFAGIDKISEKVMAVIEKIRAPIDKALDWLVNWIVTMAKTLFTKVFGKKDNTKEKAGADSARPVAAVPFALAGTSHELTFESRGDGVEIDMASGNKLPLAEKFKQAHVAIDNFKHYIDTVEIPEVKAHFTTEILPKIEKLQAPQVSEFNKIYNLYFPKSDKTGVRPSAMISEAEAKERVRQLVAAANKLLADIVAWGAATGIKDLSAEAVEVTLRTQGDAAWRAGFEKTKKQIIETVRAFDYKGAPLAFTGSSFTGWRGPHKGQTHFDAKDFDVDLYVVHAADYRAAIAARAPVVNGKIFPSAAHTPELLAVSTRVRSALAAAFPGIARVGSSAIVLREKPG